MCRFKCLNISEKRELLYRGPRLNVLTKKVYFVLFLMNEMVDLVPSEEKTNCTTKKCVFKAEEAI